MLTEEGFYEECFYFELYLILILKPNWTNGTFLWLNIVLKQNFIIVRF